MVINCNQQVWWSNSPFNLGMTVRGIRTNFYWTSLADDKLIKKNWDVKDFYSRCWCTKRGATWLHKQLNSNHIIDMGFQKKYHVFDSLEGFGRDFGENQFLKGPNNRYRRNRIKAIQNLINKDKIGRNQSLKRAKRNQHAAGAIFHR